MNSDRLQEAADVAEETCPGRRDVRRALGDVHRFIGRRGRSLDGPGWVLHLDELGRLAFVVTVKDAKDPGWALQKLL